LIGRLPRLIIACLCRAGSCNSDAIPIHDGSKQIFCVVQRIKMCRTKSLHLFVMTSIATPPCQKFRRNPSGSGNIDLCIPLVHVVLPHARNVCALLHMNVPLCVGFRHPMGQVIDMWPSSNVKPTRIAIIPILYCFVMFEWGGLTSQPCPPVGGNYAPLLPQKPHP
jgi:hypothetical protein